MTRDAQPLAVWPELLGTMLLLLLPGPHLASAQSVSEYQIKAAYVYSFTKFVEWPAQEFTSPTAPIRLCVLNDPPFVAQVNQIVNGKAVAGHPVNVVLVQSGEQSRSCHILFINAAQNRQARQILEVLRNSSVLTVGETKGFVQEGGMINFVLQDDRVQFEVNHRAASQAGLRISSRLLTVARFVIK